MSNTINTMQQYRKKPVVFQVHQWDGCTNKLPSWGIEALNNNQIWQVGKCLDIQTKYGTFTLYPGDYLLMNEKNEISGYGEQKFGDDLEPVSAPSVPDALQSWKDYSKACTDHYVNQHDYCKGFEAGRSVTPVQSADPRLKEWETLFSPLFQYANKHPDIKLGSSMVDFVIDRAKRFDQAQSAGMQWVKGQYNELYAQVKSGSETPCLVDYKWDENTVCRDICRIKPHILELSARGICYGSIWQKDGQSEEEAFVIMCKSSNVEWLRESSSPSTVKEQDSEWKEQLQLAAHEREVLVKAFDKVRRLFELRSWIMEGRGSYPYNDDRYKEEVRYLYDEFDALVKDTWANIKTKSFEYQKWIIEEYLKENSSKEQETAIAFAKWMDHKGCWRNPMTTLYYLYGDNKGKDLPELYDLFIKSTTNGE